MQIYFAQIFGIRLIISVKLNHYFNFTDMIPLFASEKLLTFLAGQLQVGKTTLAKSLALL
ncbi:MAG TPA: hypothetical protein DCF33_02915 [Saprospirales bacterium]|nr:hypothetical protein [Saprospirales bacterium]